MSGAVVPRPASRGYGSPYLYYLILLFFLANLLVTIDRTALAVLIEPIRRELGLSDTQLGALSFAFATFYALFGLLLGRLSDTRSRSKLLAWSMGLLGLATAACGWTYSFVQLFLARTFCGVGEAGSVPTKYSLIGDSFRPEQRASALALIYSGIGVGVPAGLMLAGYLSGTIGWRHTFLALGAPALLVGVTIYFTSREPPRGAFEAEQAVARDATFGGTLAALGRNRTFLFIVAAFSAMIFGTYGLGYWIPSFLIRSHGMTPASVGLVYGSVTGGAMITGLLGGAVISTPLVRRDRRWEMRLPGIANLVVGGSFAIVFSTSSLGIALAFSGIANLASGLIIGPATAGIQSTVPARMRGVAASITMFVSMLFGQGLGAWSIGYASDLLRPARGEYSLGTVLLFASSAFVVSGILYLLGSRGYDRDRVD